MKEFYIGKLYLRWGRENKKIPIRDLLPQSKIDLKKVSLFFRRYTGLNQPAAVVMYGIATEDIQEGDVVYKDKYNRVKRNTI
jgi:hypothetical protein